MAHWYNPHLRKSTWLRSIDRSGWHCTPDIVCRRIERAELQAVETEQCAEVLRRSSRQDRGRRRNGPVSVQRVRAPSALVVLGEGRRTGRDQQQDKGPRRRWPQVHGDLRHNARRRRSVPDHRGEQVRKNPDHGPPRSYEWVITTLDQRGLTRRYSRSYVNLLARTGGVDWRCFSAWKI